MKNKNLTWLQKHEHLIILGLCLAGAIRLFIFNAVFPPFNNVDEMSHFDIVYKYAHAHIPRTEVAKFNKKALELIFLYHSQEYILPSSAGTVPPPPWTIPDVQQSKDFKDYLQSFQEKTPNEQAGSFPLYYAIAGLLYNAGETLGLAGGWLIYWLRFLNIYFYVALIWISYIVAKSLYPNDGSARIALPLIVTFFPQDSFYSISPDALTPLLFSVAFYMLLQIQTRDKSYAWYFLAGLFIAATFLTKISNITVFALAAAVLLLKLRKSYLERQGGQFFPKLLVLSVAAIAPVVIWLMRNYFAWGDALGTVDKVKIEGWTVKPISQWLNHPIFTPAGLWFFLSELTKTFWRGEFTWHLKIIASRGMDIFYVASTAIFVPVSFATFLARGKADTSTKLSAGKENRFELGISFFVLIVSLLFLAFLSVRFDFHDCFFPSREKPYFTTARLIGGAMLPVLIIYLDGLRRILSFLKCRRCLLLAVALIVIAVTWSEISLSIPVFASPYNLFHLR